GHSLRYVAVGRLRPHPDQVTRVVSLQVVRGKKPEKNGKGWGQGNADADAMAGPALRRANAGEESRVHRGCGSDTCVGHRGEYSDFQLFGCLADQAFTLPEL